MKQKDFLKQLDHQAIFDAIRRAEKHTSGEIRVHVEPRLWGRDPMDVARRTFERLGMTKTALRNGVLLFVAAHEQKFAILGDQGIDDKVGYDFWEDVAAHMTEKFRTGDFTAGIVEAVERSGEKLSAFFPFERGDTNELSNDISIGEH